MVDKAELLIQFLIMSRLLPSVAAMLFAAFTPISNLQAELITIDWVTVGDPGNAADTSGAPNPAGAVADSFRIMKFEFQNLQYTAFLNAVDPNGTNPNSVYNANMGSNARGGISFTSGAASGSKYAVKTDMGDKPVNFVSGSTRLGLPTGSRTAVRRRGRIRSTT